MKKIGKDYEYIKEISFVDCRGKRVNLSEVYIEGIERKVNEVKAFKKEYKEYLNSREKSETE